MRSSRWRKWISRLGLYLAAAAVAVFVLAPFAWLVISSIAASSDLLSKPLHWWPQHASLERYLAIFTSSDTGAAAYTFRHALWNSVRVAGLSTLIAMVTGVPAAYALARFRFRGRSLLTLTFLGSYMLPPIALTIALYLILGILHLRDTVLGLSLVYSSFVTPYVVWVMRGAFATIPVELEEAAWVDGAGRFGAFGRIALPLTRPALVTTLILAVLTAWDEFLYALILTSSIRAKTVPVAIAEFTGQHHIDYGMIAAGGVLAALPPVLVALFLQRLIIRGLTAGAVKG